MTVAVAAVVVAALAALAALVAVAAARWHHFQGPAIYVRTMWGLANRLRCMRVAYDAAASLGRPLVVLHAPDDGYAGRHMRDLFCVPGLTFGSASRAPPRGVRRMVHNVANDCTLETTLREIRRHPRVLIEACGLALADVPDRQHQRPAVMYARMRPSPEVLRACAPVLAALRGSSDGDGRGVGVHIRQGSVPDFRLGYFFGPWDNADQSVLPTRCCFRDAALNASPCPENAPPMEAFVRRMRECPDGTVFFVCSDRPGCLAHLHREFPGRVVSNAAAVTATNDGFTAFCDWWCLSQCSSLILSAISSFSAEALRVRGIPHVLV